MHCSHFWERSPSYCSQWEGFQAACGWIEYCAGVLYHSKRFGVGHIHSTVLQNLNFSRIAKFLIQVFIQRFLLDLIHFINGSRKVIPPIICRGILPVRSPARAVLGFHHQSRPLRACSFSVIGTSGVSEGVN